MLKGCVVLVQVEIHDRLRVTLPLKRNYAIQSISKAQTDDKQAALTSYSSLAMVFKPLSRNNRDGNCCDFRRARREDNLQLEPLCEYSNRWIVLHYDMVSRMGEDGVG